MIGGPKPGRGALATYLATLLVLVALAAWPPPAAAQAASPVWARAYGGVADDALYTMATDGAGNIYSGGIITSPTFEAAPGIVLTRIGAVDMLVMKVDVDGRVVWARNFGGANVDARVMALTTDAAGNVFFTASYMDNAVDIGGFYKPAPPTPNSMNMVVARLRAADGAADWAVHFSANASTSVILAGRVALDPSGNPVVVADFGYGDIDVLGQTLTAGSAIQAMLVAKLDGATGDRLWASSHGGTGMIFPAGVGIDPTGNIYVSGYYELGSPDFGGTVLNPQGNQDLFLAKLDPAGAAIWAKAYGGAGANTLNTMSSVAVDPSGAAYLSAVFANADIAVGGTTLTWRAGAADNYDIQAFKVDTSGDVVWARSWGTSQGNSLASSIARDAAGHIYLVGYTSAGIQFGAGGPATTQIGQRDGLLLRLDADSGDVAWAASYGGPGAIMPPTSVAVVSPSRIAIGGGFRSGPITVGPTTLPAGAGQRIFLVTVAQIHPLAVAVSGAGTVRSVPTGISCGAACSAGFEMDFSVTLAATPDSGQAFIGWSGDCSGTTATIVLTLSAARSCNALFTNGSAPPAPPAMPPFVNAANPPPPAISVETSDTGQGRLSLAAYFNSLAGLAITTSQSSGAALPSWLHFDPATLSFTYDLPLPPTLPDVRAGRSAVNAVFPPAILVQTVPVTLTLGGGGQSYAITIDLDFHAPRQPGTMTALSYGATGDSGNAASRRPALSWDGGQVVFETLATNINRASGANASIARYHGLSGRRDLLSQTAIPGGGVANGADGRSNNPAVAASGSHAAFSSDAPGVSLTPNNGLRQVYRTGLAWPRIPTNEAATPAAIIVSATASGLAADAAADRPSLSEHGDFVAFESAAGNLGVNPDRSTQVWRKDMSTGVVALISSTIDGRPGNGDSRNVSLSWNGGFAAFDSSATNLVAGRSGRQIYLKDMAGGHVYWLGTGSAPSLDARAASVVHVGAGQILRYDVATGATTIVSATPSGAAGNGDSTQASVSADGRFVAFRSTATDLVAGHAGNGEAQIWVRDVMRGVTALVSQTAAGAPGGGASADPALSGDGSQIVFASLARDLVNGTPQPGQIHLAANPLVLPGGTAYWYSTDGGNQTWSIERWGNQALVAGLAYAPDGGTAVWAAGSCAFAGLTCQGSVSQWGDQGTTASVVGPVTLAFAADGRTATATLGGSAPRNLALYPVGGPRTTVFAGLPQAGYWGVTGNAAGVSSLFIDTDTQAGTDGRSTQQMHVTLFGYDIKGNAQWYAAQGELTGQAFSGQLYLYAGGASWAGGGASVPSGALVGTLRLTFTASDRAMAQLPDGRTIALSRWRF